VDIKEVSYPDLALVDIETTGCHFDRDRITEIGIKTLASNQIRPSSHVRIVLDGLALQLEEWSS
jgi:hypothetical protein